MPLYEVARSNRPYERVDSGESDAESADESVGVCVPSSLVARPRIVCSPTAESSACGERTEAGLFEACERSGVGVAPVTRSAGMSPVDADDVRPLNLATRALTVASLSFDGRGGGLSRGP